MIRLDGAVAPDERDVGRKVPAQLPVEVRSDVGVVPVDPGVDDADQDLPGATFLLVRAVGGRVDHLHVPLQTGERLGAALVMRIAEAACTPAVPDRALRGKRGGRGELLSRHWRAHADGPAGGN